jgi:hypothetical protein
MNPRLRDYDTSIPPYYQCQTALAAECLVVREVRENPKAPAGLRGENPGLEAGSITRGWLGPRSPQLPGQVAEAMPVVDP